MLYVCSTKLIKQNNENKMNAQNTSALFALVELSNVVDTVNAGSYEAAKEYFAERNPECIRFGYELGDNYQIYQLPADPAKLVEELDFLEDDPQLTEALKKAYPATDAPIISDLSFRGVVVGEVHIDRLTKKVVAIYQHDPRPSDVGRGVYRVRYCTWEIKE